MKIDLSYLIEKCASSDVARPNLVNAYYEPAKKRIAATNGHILAVCPVVPCDGDVEGPISAEALKAARKGAKLNNGDVVITANGTLSVPHGATFPRPSAVTFPPIDSVIPDQRPGQEGTISLTFNPHLLLDLVNAIGVGKNESVTLTVTKKGLTGKYAGQEAIHVEPNQAGNGAFGVLMPVRRK
jgi:hypothetical protein